MLIVVTGLDGSGTSTIAQKLHELDDGSYLLKTPSPIFSDRDKIDDLVRKDSPCGHMLYYLSSTVYMSDYIKNNLDYVGNNVYVVRYLIDTVVSNRVAGININLDYNIYGNQLLIPDVTLFVKLSEEKRQIRISNRGKSELDKVLDNDGKRNKFLEEFNHFLIPDSTIFINNDSENVDDIVSITYQKLKQWKNK